MAWIAVVDADMATGKLKEVYDRAMRRAGKVFNILKIQSLNPVTLKASVEMYTGVMREPSGLSHAEREMLAVVVSWANQCFY